MERSDRFLRLETILFIALGAVLSGSILFYYSNEINSEFVINWVVINLFIIAIGYGLEVLFSDDKLYEIAFSDSLEENKKILNEQTRMNQDLKQLQIQLDASTDILKSIGTGHTGNKASDKQEAISRSEDNIKQNAKKLLKNGYYLRQIDDLTKDILKIRENIELREIEYLMKLNQLESRLVIESDGIRFI